MAYGSFRKFIDALDEAGELKRVAVPIDTDLLKAKWALTHPAFVLEEEEQAK